MRPLVGVIILNFNRASDTIECVESLQTCSYQNMLIWVVDNGSTDGSENILRGRLRGIELFQTGSNLGFAAGNNWAFNKIKGRKCKYLLLLNNDTLVDPLFLEKLVDELENNQQAAVAGGTIFEYSDKDRVWYAGGTFEFWRATCTSRIAGKAREDICFGNNIEVTFVTGCLFLLRVEALKDQKLFDPRFFMYFEDCELSIRLHQSGNKLIYVPQAIIYHKVAHGGTTPFTLYFGVRNRFLFLDLVSNGFERFVGHTYLYFVFSVKALWWIVTAPRLAMAVAYGWFDYIKGNFEMGRGNQMLHNRSLAKNKEIKGSMCANLY